MRDCTINNECHDIIITMLNIETEIHNIIRTFDIIVPRKLSSCLGDSLIKVLRNHHNKNHDKND